jgi:hypothetical protein
MANSSTNRLDKKELSQDIILPYIATVLKPVSTDRHLVTLIQFPAMSKAGQAKPCLKVWLKKN